MKTAVHHSDAPLVRHETYGPGYRPDLIGSFDRRTSSRDAGFFAKHLRADSRVLDCGCGRGSITLGLAATATQGAVVGLDISAEMIDQARRIARDRGPRNVSFVQGSIYALAFPDDHFDAVLVHAVLQHLARPTEAMREVHRVLKPGGFAGLRDDDSGSLVLAPESPEMRRVLALMDWYLERCGGDPFAGRKHRRILLDSGFNRLVSSASCEVDNGFAETAAHADLAGSELAGAVGPAAIAAGILDERELETLLEACAQWGRDPAAFDAVTWCETLGYKPGAAG